MNMPIEDVKKLTCVCRNFPDHAPKKSKCFGLVGTKNQWLFCFCKQKYYKPPHDPTKYAKDLLNNYQYASWRSMESKLMALITIKEIEEYEAKH